MLMGGSNIMAIIEMMVSLVNLSLIYFLFSLTTLHFFMTIFLYNTYTVYTYIHTGSRPLYGQGPVIRKYYPYRCKGENNGQCKKGEKSEASAVSIAEKFDNKNSR